MCALLFSCEHCQATFVGERKINYLTGAFECICTTAFRMGLEEARHDIAWYLRRHGVDEKVVLGVELNEWAR